MTALPTIDPNAAPKGATHFPSFKQFATNAVCGCFAGGTTGIAVGIVEHLKVAQEADPRQRLDRKLFREALRYGPGFSCFFAVTCAVEYSVNAYIGEAHNVHAGTVASAFSGGLFLASADHMLFLRRERSCGLWDAVRGVGLRALPTGFIPMFFREAFYMSGLTHFGPRVGVALRSVRVLGERDEEVYKFVGRYMTLVGFTLASHPFDTLKGEMQKVRLASNSPPRIAECWKSLVRSGGVFAGVLPRVMLAPFGGASSAAVFEWARSRATDPLRDLRD